MSNLSNIILTCSRCISNYPWLYSAGGTNAKGTNRDDCIVAAGIGSICTRDTCIGNT